MRFLHRTPIKRKLIIITMATSFAALLVAGLAIVANERISFRHEIVRDISILTDLYDDNVAPGLTFNDVEAITKTLQSLDANPHIIAAAVYDKAGQVVARYQRTNITERFALPPAGETGTYFQPGRLDGFRKITVAGEVIGTLFITTDLAELNDRLVHYALIVALVMVAASVIAFLLSTAMQKVISEPISHLADVVGVVAHDKNYSVRAVKRGEDELGRLMDGFNEMLDQIQARDAALREARDTLEKRVEERTRELEDIHKQLIQASRLGGMAEIATNVLHNVGNVLNSVNVSTTLIADSVKKSRVSSLAKITALFREHEHDLGTFLTTDPRGQQLPAFLAQLAEHLVKEQQTVLAEIELLQQGMEHIKEIVVMQQSYAKISGVSETVQITDLVEDALRMNAGALSRHRVTLLRQYEDMPPMNVEKHKILQILVNLIRNAKYACDESGREDKKMTMIVANGGSSVRISVVDNGVGIPPENMTRIFNHGFTTRDSGHGFGLHGCALAARQMGGSLTVRSDGRGRGATFTLELPCQPKAASPQ